MEKIMSEQIAVQEPLPFWLKGNFSPVTTEVTDTELEVIGQIPTDLKGRYLRNGPSPLNGHTDDWFIGDGMIHGVELGDGKVNWYKNRFVQTPLLNKKSGDFLGDSMTGLDHSLANTHIVGHAGKILALEELHLPFELSSELETIGAYDFGGKLKTGMTAHPKICGKTGEMMFFAYGLLPPYITYQRVSADGELLQTEEIEVKGSTMAHDFNITENYVIFMDLPVVYDLSKGGDGGLPLEWSEEYGARLGVMPRTGTNADVVWYDIDPCYVFHPLNAYEEGDKIIIDTCRMEHFLKRNAPKVPSLLTRWTIDQTKGSVDQKILSDVCVEFPRVPDSLIGQKHRFGYMVEFDAELPYGIAIIKHDFETNHQTHVPLAANYGCSEPVFVAKENGVKEDDGYLMYYVYDMDQNKSEFVIRDAANIEADPLARVMLPVRVPYGFHGSWIAD
jgi:carotenoid cleavage dioxygenase-like enzyme